MPRRILESCGHPPATISTTLCATEPRRGPWRPVSGQRRRTALGKESMRAATLESDASLRSTREAKLSTEFKASGSSYQCAWKPRLISAPFLPGPSPHFSAKTASSDGTHGSAEAAAPGGARWVRQASGEGARPRLPARDWSPSRGARPAPGGLLGGSGSGARPPARPRVPLEPRGRTARPPGRSACAPPEVTWEPRVCTPRGRLRPSRVGTRRSGPGSLRPAPEARTQAGHTPGGSAAARPPFTCGCHRAGAEAAAAERTLPARPHAAGRP